MQAAFKASSTAPTPPTRRPAPLTAGLLPRYRVQYSASSLLDSTVSRNSQSVTSGLPVRPRICSEHQARKAPVEMGGEDKLRLMRGNTRILTA